MTDRVPIPLPLLGVSEVISADQQEPGTTARALNVRGVDPREPGRIRLAQRSGLGAHGAGAQVAGGSPVVAMFQAVKDTPPERWVELTGTPAANTTPAQVSTGWSKTLDAEPVTAKVGPDGNGYFLLANGNVVIVSERGKVLGSIDAAAPFGFTNVPDLGVDEDGAIYTMASHPRRIDGGAGRMYRFRKRDDFWERESEVVVEWTPRAFVYDRGEILFSAIRPDDWDNDPEEDGPAPFERLYRYGGVKGAGFEVWNAPAASPAVMVAANERGDVYVASSRNESRVPSAAAVATPTVDWVPREAASGADGVNASQALYFHCSALRAQNVQGLADGAVPERWIDARHDESDFAVVRDTTQRDLISLVQRKPLFDTNGMQGAPGWVFNGARGFVSVPASGFHEKTTADDVAAWCKSVFPNMRNSAGAGDRFTVTILFRIDAFDATDDPRYVFTQGDYSLRYDDNAGNTEFTFTYPNGGSVSSAATFVGRGARGFVFTFVHGGHGTVNGSSVSIQSGAVTWAPAAFTANINQAAERTCIGGYAEMLAPTWSNHSGRFNEDDVVWNRGLAWTCNISHEKNRVQGVEDEPGAESTPGTYWTQVTKLGLSGAIAEIVTFLGGTSAPTTPHNTTNTSTLYQKVEGFVAHAYGRQGVLDSIGPHPYSAAPPNGTGTVTPWATTGALVVPQALTAKYARTDGRLMWTFTSNAAGNAVVATKEDYFYTATVESDAAVNVVRIRKHKDEGRSVRSSGSDTWQEDDGARTQWLGQRVQLTVDAFGDLYVPWVDINATTARSLRRYAFEGNGAGGPVNTWTYELGSDAYPVVALPTGLYVDETDTAGAVGPEFLFVASVDRGTPLAPVYEAKRVDVLGRQATGTTVPRSVTLLAVTENGTVSRYGTAWTSVAATVLPGSYVWTATLYSKTFLGNGSTYRVYDHRNTTLRAFEEATVGKIPPRCRLGVPWRGRLVLARGDSAHDWFMSAFANPFDWEFVPDVVTETQAVSGASSQVGEVPDIVNALVPWSDDLLIFGCDSSIWRLTGDPMSSGELHRVSDITGMAFGQAWCKDPEQRIYFWGSRGGLYVASPDGGVQSLSEGRLDRRLKAIDLGKYTVRLVWNDLDCGVHAFLVSVDGTGEPYHYFWERKTGAFWIDQFHGAGRQVRGVFLADGDAATDRALLLGCADGRIRKWSPIAEDDDGEMIRSTCLVGPVTLDTQGVEVRLTALEAVLARDQGGCQVGIAATAEADVPYHLETAALLNPGRNGYTRMRARGSHLWVELAASEVGRAWAVEDLAAHMSPAGRKRVR